MLVILGINGYSHRVKGLLQSKYIAIISKDLQVHYCYISRKWNWVAPLGKVLKYKLLSVKDDAYFIFW